jgi:hypothetical protein
MSTEALLLEDLNTGDIFDLEEEELFKSEDDSEKTFQAFLNSNWDF